MKEFCDLLIKKKIDVTWSCMSRIDFVDEDVLKPMKKAGCHQICYGIESGDEQILKNIKKPLSIEKTKRICKATENAGIAVRLSFMLGSPGETRETMEKTIRLAIKLNPDLVQFNITTPYPGTEMFSWAKEQGRLKTYNWRDYNLSTMVMELP